METTVATVTSAPGNIPTTTIIPTTAENCDDDGNCHSEAVIDYDTTGQTHTHIHIINIYELIMLAKP